jgi:hypothetical protein
MGPYEFMPSSELLTMIGQAMCHEQAPTVEMCANALFMVGGFNSEQLNRVSVQISMQCKDLQIFKYIWHARRCSVQSGHIRRSGQCVDCRRH